MDSISQINSRQVEEWLLAHFNALVLSKFPSDIFSEKVSFSYIDTVVKSALRNVVAFIITRNQIYLNVPIDYLEIKSGTTEFSREEYTLIRFGTRDYIIYTSTQNAPGDIVITITDAAPNAIPDTLKKREFLTNRKHFKSITVVCDRSLKSIFHEIAEHCVSIVDVCGKIIDSQVLDYLTARLASNNTVLYRILRDALPMQLFEKTFLYLIDPNALGGMVMDSETMSRVFSKFSSMTLTLPVSPLSVVHDLLTFRFPTKDTVAREIFPDMAIAIRDTRAIPSASKVGLHQFMLYDREYLVLQPLAKTSRYWLEAGYPASHRSEIEPLLRLHQSAFQRALSNHHDPTISTHAAHDKRDVTLRPPSTSDWYQKVGEALGAFTGALLKSGGSG